MKLLDGFNQQRFAGKAELLGAWESVTNVYGPVTRRRGEEITDGIPESLDPAA